MSNHAIQDAENTFVKAEPVIAAHAGAAIVGYVGTLLITHGVVTHDQASALTQQVLPAVVAGLLVVLGVVVRRFVAPAALFAQRVEEEVQKRLEGASPTVTAGLSGQPYTLPVTTVTSGASGGYSLLPNGPYVTTSGTTSPAAASTGDDPIELSASDFLPVTGEVATEPQPDGLLPADPASGAHAADPSPAPPA